MRVAGRTHGNHDCDWPAVRHTLQWGTRSAGQRRRSCREAFCRPAGNVPAAPRAAVPRAMGGARAQAFQQTRGQCSSHLHEHPNLGEHTVAALSGVVIVVERTIVRPGHGHMAIHSHAGQTYTKQQHASATNFAQGFKRRRINLQKGATMQQ